MTKTISVFAAFVITASGCWGQISGAGSLGCNGQASTGTTWTTSTTISTTQPLASAITAPAVMLVIDTSAGTFTAGAVTIQEDPGDGNFVTLDSWRIQDPTTPPFAVISLPYTLLTNTKKQFIIDTHGIVNLQLTLSTAITGSSVPTVTPAWTPTCAGLKLFSNNNLNQLNGTNFNTGTGASGAGTPRVTVANDSSLAANQSVNTNQVGGTAIDTNSGNKSAGTQRMVIATDQPNLTTALNVALAANQTTNVAQVGGTATDTNSGNKSAGTLRTVIATDQPNLTTPLNVALAANQTVNEAQINGVTPLMNNGASGTGSERMNIANDNTAIANWGQGAIGSAVPNGGQYLAGNGSGSLTGLMTCDSSAFLDMTTATTTQIVALSSGKSIYVCHLALESNGTASVKLEYGTGSNCVTSPVALTPNYDFTAQTGISEGTGLGMLFKTIASNELCVVSSAAVNVHAFVTYTQF